MPGSKTASIPASIRLAAVLSAGMSMTSAAGNRPIKQPYKALPFYLHSLSFSRLFKGSFMQIKDAKNIPLAQLVEHLGGKYAHTDRNKQHWYFSPFRPNEKTPSFKINEPRNTWYDFGHANPQGKSGGDPIDLWCDYYGKDRLSSLKEALAALAVFAGQPHIKPVERRLTAAEQMRPP